jgi:hypothetical protein
MSSGSKRAGSGVARLLAVIASVALIAGGLLIRKAIDDNDDDASDDPAGSTVPDEPDETASDVVCITELADACDAIAASDVDVTVAVEPAGTTLDRLAALEDADEAPLWITIDPFPAMVDELRTAAGEDAIGYSGGAAGATQIGVALPKSDRWALLVGDECGPTRVWRCLGDWAGTPWADHGGASIAGTVRPAVGDAAGSAIGLAGLAAAVAGFTGNGTIGSVTELEANPEFSIWFDGVYDTVPIGRDPNSTPLATMLVRRSALDVASATGAEFESSNPARTSDFEIRYPDGTMWATAVLASPGSTAAPDGLLDQLSAALTEMNWDDAALGAAHPLPNASIMLALRELWRNQ